MIFPWAAEVIHHQSPGPGRDRLQAWRTSDHRRTGLGRHILAHLHDVALAAGAERIILETSTAWTEAVDFYLSCGYAITHTEDGEFDPGTWFEKRL